MHFKEGEDKSSVGFGETGTYKGNVETLSNAGASTQKIQQMQPMETVEDDVSTSHLQRKDSLNFTFDSLSQGEWPSNDYKSILDKYVFESMEADPEKMKNSDRFYIKRYPDALFFGEVERNACNKLIRQGLGVMKYRNGRVFEGDWDDDVRHGRGFEKYVN